MNETIDPMLDLMLPARADSVDDVRRDLLEKLVYAVGKDPAHAVLDDWCTALSLVVRDHMVTHWMRSTRDTYRRDAKRVYYLSMEFLVGRLLHDAVDTLGLEAACRNALLSFGIAYDAVREAEADAALGNGGLGRLAACLLDSMSSLGIAAYGYGIRYEHGLFRQRIDGGWQVEEPEDWLTSGHVWEFKRPEVAYTIGFGGHVETGKDGRATWHTGDSIVAMAYDMPVLGWRAAHVNTLRLWSAKPTLALDLEQFNRGDHVSASEHAVRAATISRVLYPDDTTDQGKELRLKQEYFFTAASLQDMMRRFLSQHDDLSTLPQHAAIQLNDTHPAIAVAELVRMLVDLRGMAFEAAMEVARGCIHYTNHTLMPEALERWPVGLIGRVLPRHLEIIRRIDIWHHDALAARGEAAAFDTVKIIADGMVRMGELAFVGSRRVNGVSALHTELMKGSVFKELHRLYPDRIVNQTNGITPRRWLHGCNPPLRDLLLDAIGDGWVADLGQIEAVGAFADDAGFQERFRAAKRINKVALAKQVAERNGLTIDPDALFDIHIKRIHEYKRQLLNILEAVALYFAIRRDPDADWTPRVKVFAGKAAPGYAMAKLVIKLINDVAVTVNGDPMVGDRLKIVFLSNYNVSLAERIISAADLSEQVSTAGLEASGTGNMKLALNGALTIGTLDGANVEIRDRVGNDDIYIFGLTAEEIERSYHNGYDSSALILGDPELAEAVAAIAEGRFSPDDPSRYWTITDRLHHDDHFRVCADFTAYYATQRRVDTDFRATPAWTARAIRNTAGVGWFSSDRTIRGYARDIWQVPAQDPTA